MKVLLLTLGLTMAATAHAGQQGQRPDPAQFQAAIQACQESSYNTTGVTFPTPQPGERPQLTQDQMNLLHACEAAGILPQHPHGPPPRQPAGNGGAAQ